jgi:hypothetical protein
MLHWVKEGQQDILRPLFHFLKSFIIMPEAEKLSTDEDDPSSNCFLQNH